jgi:hypothetical protein
MYFRGAISLFEINMAFGGKGEHRQPTAWGRPGDITSFKDSSKVHGDPGSG